MTRTRASVASRIDHTLLKPEATDAQVAALVAEAAELGAFSVCVSASRLPVTVPAGLAVCTVVGFPSGAHHSDVKAAEAALSRAHITCNKNGVPFDPEKPMVTSGIRLGTPACTTRGFGVAEFRRVGELIVEVLDGLAKHDEDGNAETEAAAKARAHELTRRFPIYA